MQTDLVLPLWTSPEKGCSVCSSSCWAQETVGFPSWSPLSGAFWQGNHRDGHGDREGWGHLSNWGWDHKGSFGVLGQLRGVLGLYMLYPGIIQSSAIVDCVLESLKWDRTINYMTGPGTNVSQFCTLWLWLAEYRQKARVLWGADAAGAPAVGFLFPVHVEVRAILLRSQQLWQWHGPYDHPTGTGLIPHKCHLSDRGSVWPRASPLHSSSPHRANVLFTEECHADVKTLSSRLARCLSGWRDLLPSQMTPTWSLGHA